DAAAQAAGRLRGDGPATDDAPGGGARRRARDPGLAARRDPGAQRREWRRAHGVAGYPAGLDGGERPAAWAPRPACLECGRHARWTVADGFAPPSSHPAASAAPPSPHTPPGV